MNTDMPIISARQAWYWWSAVKAQDERSMTYSKSTPKSQQPRYEKGIGEIINSLPSLYVSYGNFCWGYNSQTKYSAHWVRHNKYLTRRLAEDIEAQDKSKKWKARTIKLAPFAVEQAWYNSPVDMSANNKHQIPKKTLAKIAGVEERHFQRDAGTHWRFLLNTLSEWEKSALEDLGEWVAKKKAA